MRSTQRWMWIGLVSFVWTMPCFGQKSERSGGAPGPRGPTKSDDLASRRLDEVLARWEASWASTRAVEARFVLVKRYPRWGSEERFEGTALVAMPDQLRVTLSVVESDPEEG